MGRICATRVLACGEMTPREVARRFGVSPSYISKVRARWRKLGDPRPGLQRSNIPLRLAPFADAMCARLNATPDAKLNDLRSWLEETYGVSVSYSVLWKVLARLGFTLKTYGPPRLQVASSVWHEQSALTYPALG